jgi:uncharacterized membrane protein YdjX (TVP38/TMEM64 family)
MLRSRLKNKKVLAVGKVLLVVVALSVALRWLIPSLNSPEVRIFVEKLGPFGPLVIVAYTVISHVLAPLAGTPGVLLSLALFGVSRTLVYIYFASIISASICFGIARQFGRGWVARLIGGEAMAEVDRFAETSGVKILILSRIFGFSLFEIISYAAGLTTISFKKYFTVTAIFILVPNIILSFAFKDLDFYSGNSFLIWLGILVFTGLLFSYFLRRCLVNRSVVESK